MIPPLVFLAAAVYMTLAGFGVVPRPWYALVLVAVVGSAAMGWMAGS